MFDINAIVNAAIASAVEARLTEVLQQHANTVAALATRIAALENNPAQGVDTTLEKRVAVLESVPSFAINKTQVIEALDSQEWFWSKINDYVERQMDDHLQTYDHDDYDNAVSTVDDLPDFDDFVTKDDMNQAIQDTLTEARLKIVF